jgi:hypothetical protein
MSSEGAVTNWIGQLQTGNAAAAQALWVRYFHRFVYPARKKLQGVPRRVADEEGVALSCAPSTIERKLQQIRSLWSTEHLP